jgi:hypothetical protein
MHGYIVYVPYLKAIDSAGSRRITTIFQYTFGRYTINTFQDAGLLVFLPPSTSPPPQSKCLTDTQEANFLTPLLADRASCNPAGPK